MLGTACWVHAISSFSMRATVLCVGVCATACKVSCSSGSSALPDVPCNWSNLHPSMQMQHAAARLHIHLRMTHPSTEPSCCCVLLLQVPKCNLTGISSIPTTTAVNTQVGFFAYALLLPTQWQLGVRQDSRPRTCSMSCTESACLAGPLQRGSSPCASTCKCNCLPCHNVSTTVWQLTIVLFPC
jgi:hypothetical protein